MGVELGTKNFFHIICRPEEIVLPTKKEDTETLKIDPFVVYSLVLAQIIYKG